MRRVHWIIAGTAVALVSAGRPALPDVDLSGKYSIVSAQAPDGGTYTGNVDLKKTRDSYSVSWALPGQPAFKGVGVQVGSTLGVGWADRGRYGVAAYQVRGGKLEGRWSTSGLNGGVGTETLEGPSGLNGSYRITGSRSPDTGKPYSGTVNIRPNGDTYTVKWSLAGESYEGVGVRQGDVLVVGWGIGAGSVGVVAYQVGGPTLKGVWANPGGKKAGTETLRRRG